MDFIRLSRLQTPFGSNLKAEGLFFKVIEVRKLLKRSNSERLLRSVCSVISRLIIRFEGFKKSFSIFFIFYYQKDHFLFRIQCSKTACCRKSVSCLVLLIRKDKMICISCRSGQSSAKYFTYVFLMFTKILLQNRLSL